uniref:PX domain-containing protein n=1 Tax=Arcella intermedia TaxID=1963864 RepID=A0A6B2LQ70_9EUKA
MNIEVTNPIIIKDSSGKPDFTVYSIQVETSFPEYSSSNFEVKRRYSDFVWLRNYLTMRMEEKGKKLSIPELPGDSWSSWFGPGRFEKEFIEERRVGLDQFMKSVANHPWARFEEGLHKFLEKQDFICQE